MKPKGIASSAWWRVTREDRRWMRRQLARVYGVGAVARADLRVRQRPYFWILDYNLPRRRSA